MSIYKTNGNHALTDDFQIVKYKAKEEEIMASTLDSYVNREFLLLLHSLYYYLLTKYYIFFILRLSVCYHRWWEEFYCKFDGHITSLLMQSSLDENK